MPPDRCLDKRWHETFTSRKLRLLWNVIERVHVALESPSHELNASNWLDAWRKQTFHTLLTLSICHRAIFVASYYGTHRLTLTNCKAQCGSLVCRFARTFDSFSIFYFSLIYFMLGRMFSSFHGYKINKFGEICLCARHKCRFILCKLNTKWMQQSQFTCGPSHAPTRIRMRALVERVNIVFIIGSVCLSSTRLHRCYTIQTGTTNAKDSY